MFYYQNNEVMKGKGFVLAFSMCLLLSSCAFFEGLFKKKEAPAPPRVETETAIRNHMDKVKSEAMKIKNADIQQLKDAKGLDAIKVTFNSGILFATGESSLTESSKESLNDLAEVLNNNSICDVAILGYTDNVAFRGFTAEQSIQKNKDLSLERASAVASYLQIKGVSINQIKAIEGMGAENPVASNDTEAGRRQNRRVEIFLYASQAMIDAAAAGTLE